MKPEPSHPKLPSISELLKHPTVDRIVGRINRTTLAQRAAGFVDELQASLHKRGAQGVVPSLQQLAERLAQRLLEPAEQSFTAINATGAIWSERWPALPLAEVAVHEMLRLTSEYHETSNVLFERVEQLLMKLTGAEAAWVGRSYGALAAAVGTRGEEAIALAPQAGLLDPGEFGLTAVETIQSRLTSGAQAVGCEGCGLLGGPCCGILVGRRREIAELSSQLTADSIAVDTLTLAALAATLEVYQQPDQVIHKIPAWQLLTAPLENLQQRCERLAPLIAESPLIDEARPTQCDSAWYDTGEVKYAGPTWALKLCFKESSREDVARLLKASSPHVVGREQPDAIWLDLRAVFPRWDQQVVTALVGEA